MPLPWVRLDTTFPSNPKLLALLQRKEGHRAALVYVCMLAYSGAHGTDGFIPADALPFVHARHADVTLLVTHNFVYPQAGGWLIHGWAEFQESSLEAQSRRKRAQELAAVRWNGHVAMTDAERAKLYRERKRAGQDG